MEKGNHCLGEIEILQENPVLTSPYARVWHDDVVFPSGAEGKYLRVTCGSGVSVGVLPITEDGRAVLIRNYRHGIRGWCVEVPKGGVEPGEDPEEAARRELLEETGYAAGPLQFVGLYAECPGIFSGKMYCYIARDCRRQGEPRAEETEAISEILTAEPRELLPQAGAESDLVTELLAMKYLMDEERQA